MNQHFASTAVPAYVTRIREVFSSRSWNRCCWVGLMREVSLTIQVPMCNPHSFPSKNYFNEDTVPAKASESYPSCLQAVLAVLVIIPVSFVPASSVPHTLFKYISTLPLAIPPSFDPSLSLKSPFSCDSEA